MLRTASTRCAAHARSLCSAIRYLPAVEGAPPPGAFSRATVHGGLVYVSGTGGAENDTGGHVTTLTATEETSRALANVATVLRAAGSSPKNIVTAQMLLTDKSHCTLCLLCLAPSTSRYSLHLPRRAAWFLRADAECNAAYVAWFAEHGGPDLPARTTALWGVPTAAKVAFSVVAAVSVEA
jgi:2-iminobutanoate/2-iminopropanoate deaminase